ncbi:MAG: hypothetical protein JNL11_05875 [Bdellovibrionaceae bacterium]|nr:hypothetical protein [Pseudobdellovibrionaceae bacterium]
MKISVFLVTALVFSMAWSQQRPSRVETEILDLTREINQSVRFGQLSRHELESLRDQLRDVVDVMNGGGTSLPSNVICTKGSNGLFYPTSNISGSILGSTSYSAGHNTLEDCRLTLPARGEVLSCFKQSNGLYYPSKGDSGTVVGSISHSAGHGALSECRLTLPKRRATTACFKQSNGLYYPSSAETGTVIGSTSYSAGYGNLATCLKIVNQ